MGSGGVGLVFIAGFLCGLITTVASSGAAVSLPLLLAVGLDPVMANATNRLPILAASLSAVISYHRQKAIDWQVVWKAGLPTSLGSAVGALISLQISSREFKLAIAAAVAVALFMLFFRLRKTLDSEQKPSLVFGLRQFLVFLAIGVWIGFIVLDGATFLLLALTGSVGLGLVAANSVKSALILPSVMVSVLVFEYQAVIDWQIGALLSLGSVFGGYVGARVATSAVAKQIIFWTLVVVLIGEAANLLWQFLSLMAR
ncbi:MAG: sulfite exporter TauE/SafE family protein [Novosphingobium sp.]|uniref:sulfite exporter TauE/SafE family protein n=1 Tax=Novosphingobium sp. TaxID=1874826 RepID=UPI0030186C8A